jgi:hypothetical protein
MLVVGAQAIISRRRRRRFPDRHTVVDKDQIDENGHGRQPIEFLFVKVIVGVDVETIEAQVGQIDHTRGDYGLLRQQTLMGSSMLSGIVFRTPPAGMLLVDTRFAITIIIVALFCCWGTLHTNTRPRRRRSQHCAPVLRSIIDINQPKRELLSCWELRMFNNASHRSWYKV